MCVVLLPSNTPTRSLPIIRPCCVRFEYLHRVKYLQNMLLIFMILYFERMRSYNIAILEDFFC